MMASGMLQRTPASIGNAMIHVPVPTNIGIAVAGHMIALALPTFLQSQ